MARRVRLDKPKLRKYLRTWKPPVRDYRGPLPFVTQLLRKLPRLLEQATGVYRLSVDALEAPRNRLEGSFGRLDTRMSQGHIYGWRRDDGQLFEAGVGHAAPPPKPLKVEFIVART